jgi:hypothetical protein
LNCEMYIELKSDVVLDSYHEWRHI